MIGEIKGKCQYEGCEQLAVTIAQGRSGYEKGLPLGLYCEAHARIVADQGSPEYIGSCPNCGCQFGIN